MSKVLPSDPSSPQTPMSEVGGRRRNQVGRSRDQSLNTGRQGLEQLGVGVAPSLGKLLKGQDLEREEKG